MESLKCKLKIFLFPHIFFRSGCSFSLAFPQTVRIHLSIFIAFNVQFAFLNEITQKLYINQHNLSNVHRGTLNWLPGGGYRYLAGHVISA